jgi:hypothetical protein
VHTANRERASVGPPSYPIQSDFTGSAAAVAAREYAGRLSPPRDRCLSFEWGNHRAHALTIGRRWDEAPRSEGRGWSSLLQESRRPRNAQHPRSPPATVPGARYPRIFRLCKQPESALAEAPA